MAQSNRADFIDFYTKSAKPLILNLNSFKDRCLASAWLKRLIQETTVPEESRMNYTKLLLFSLVKGKLDPPFSQHPNSIETLEELPENQNLGEMLETLNQNHSNNLGNNSQIFILDFSGDLRTYVAYQNIENFGVHCYYALSNEPLTSWQRFDQNLFPGGVAPKGIMGGLNEQEEEEPEKGSAKSLPPEDEEMEKKKNEFREKLEEKVKNDKQSTLQVPTIGKINPPTDDRIPPNWGSNLLIVKARDDDK